MGDSTRKVVAPAIAMMILGGVGAAFCLFFAFVGLAGWAFGQPLIESTDPAKQSFENLVAFVSILSMAIVALVALFAAWKMKRLESYGWAWTACVLSMIPCYNSRCIAGIPLGIWGISALVADDVKALFRDRLT